jgi:CRP-like cAMP-binding protein
MNHGRAALISVFTVSPWFAALPPRLREFMVSRATLIRLRPGEQLFRQGDMPRAWYGLVRGEVHLSTVREDGKEHIMSVAEVGNWVGEAALIVMQPYLNNATARCHVEALALPREAFDELMGDAEFARAVAVLVTRRFRLLYAGLYSTSLRSTRARIAQRLRLLAHGDASGTPQPRQRLSLSQETLAMMLGITRQTLSSELKWFVQQGILRLGYRSIEVLSESELRHISDMHGS